MQTIKSKNTRDDKKLNMHPKNKTNETKTRSRRVILLLLPLSTLFWAAGCEDYYSSSPGYHGPGPYYGGGSVVVADRDRRYYRGPGYTYGRVYYVWEPGHWHGGPVSLPPVLARSRYLTLVGSCGSMGITSRKDTKPLRLARRRHVSRLPSRDQSTQQTEKRADERFPKIMAP